VFCGPTPLSTQTFGENLAKILSTYCIDPAKATISSFDARIVLGYETPGLPLSIRDVKAPSGLKTRVHAVVGNPDNTPLRLGDGLNVEAPSGLKTRDDAVEDNPNNTPLLLRDGLNWGGV
jgi:hypothetical protein